MASSKQGHGTNIIGPLASLPFPCITMSIFSMKNWIHVVDGQTVKMKGGIRMTMIEKKKMYIVLSFLLSDTRNWETNYTPCACKSFISLLVRMSPWWVHMRNRISVVDATVSILWNLSSSLFIKSSDVILGWSWSLLEKSYLLVLALVLRQG